MKQLYIKTPFYLCTMLLCSMTACEKWLQPSASDSLITSDRVLGNDSLTLAARNGLVNSMVRTYGLLNGHMTKYGGLLADELQRTASQPHPVDEPFAANNLLPESEVVKQAWRSGYNYIYTANELIAGLADNKSVSPEVRALVLGESCFFRALTYLHLVCLFGDVPLVLTTDFGLNSQLSRTPVAVVYDQIIRDLRSAELLLPDHYTPYAAYPDARVHANKSAARALLARAFLYAQRWAEAEAAATLVIRHPLYVLESDVQKVFLSESSEAIFQLPPFTGNQNTAEGSLFVPGSPGGRPPFVLTKELLDRFEPGDRRRAWVRTVAQGSGNFSSPFKYRVNGSQATTELNTVLRLAELFLIRAEARIQLGKLHEGTLDLNTVRVRAGLSALTDTMNREIALEALENERRVELHSEWGHRWLDLVRWPSLEYPYDSLRRRADDVLAVIKPGWSWTDKRWPVPRSEMQLNPNLKQNPGY